MLLGNPIQGGITLTVLLASFLFVGGIFKAVAAIAQRFEGWGWLLLSGAIDVVLGVMIWRELPMSGLTIIGVLVGISIIFRGVSWLMVGFALKRFPTIRLTSHQLGAQNLSPYDALRAALQFGSNEVLQSLMMAEVRNQGDVQLSSQSGTGPGTGPTGGT